MALPDCGPEDEIRRTEKLDALQSSHEDPALDGDLPLMTEADFIADRYDDLTRLPYNRLSLGAIDLSSLPEITTWALLDELKKPGLGSFVGMVVSAEGKRSYRDVMFSVVGSPENAVWGASFETTVVASAIAGKLTADRKNPQWWNVEAQTAESPHTAAGYEIRVEKFAHEFGPEGKAGLLVFPPTRDAMIRLMSIAVLAAGRGADAEDIISSVKAAATGLNITTREHPVHPDGPFEVEGLIGKR